MNLKPFELPGDYFQGRRVMVTGATGFVGGRLAERLAIEHDAEVTALIRNWTRAVWVSRFKLNMLEGNVTDELAVDQATAGCDVVFHCASGGGSDREYFDINVTGTRNVIDACVKHHVKRLVYISSVAVHGANLPDGADENDDYRPSGRGYADSKIAAEKEVFKARDRGLSVSVIRPTFVWGPRSGLFTVRPLKEMAAGFFRLVDKGNGDCHAIFIETLVDSIIAAGHLDAADGRPFLVTDRYGLKWKDFFEAHARMLGNSPVHSGQALPSLSSTSAIVRYRCQLYQWLRTKLEDWKGNPAPLWRKVIRRSARVTADQLMKYGVMNQWDLQKYARVGAIDSSAVEQHLAVTPRYDFQEAIELTKRWVEDQLSEVIAS